MSKPIRLLLLCAVLLGAGAGCAPRPDAQARTLTVFAAASLTDALGEIGANFEAANPGTTVTLNMAGSSQLAAQIVEGAPADVFASANAAQMQAAIESGRIAADAPRTFVSNRLSVIVPADNPAGITALEDLGGAPLLLVLAVPGVPVRQYTDEIVAQLGSDFAAAFYANVVSEEDNVRQVVAKVALGEADAGIVYTSDVTPDVADSVLQIAIPDAQNVIATYPVAVLNDTPAPALAQAFVDYLLSADGQAILQRWGFGAPPAE